MIALAPNAQITSSTKSSWPRLDEKTVIDRIDELKKHPNLIDQGALGLCGEAAFFHHVLQRRPILFGSMAKLLFMDGIGFIGDLVIRPDWIFPDLRNADYPAIVAARLIEQALDPTLASIPPQADWMVLSALRDSENAFLDYQGTPQETISDGSYFEDELFQWYKKSGLYTLVTLDTDTDLAHVKTSVLKTTNNHIALRVNIEMIQVDTGNHIISLESPLLIDEVNDSVIFDYWTWGEASFRTFNKTVQDFTDNYLGAIIATF